MRYREMKQEDVEEVLRVRTSTRGSALTMEELADRSHRETGWSMTNGYDMRNKKFADT